jgi:hypothetical protein
MLLVHGSNVSNLYHLHNLAFVIAGLAFQIILVVLRSLIVFIADKSPVVLLGEPAVLISVGDRHVAVLVELARVEGSVAIVAIILNM